MPYVGCYTRFSGLEETLQERFDVISNVYLMWQAICAPIHVIAEQVRIGEIPIFVARELLQQHKDWVDENFGLWTDPTIEEVLTGRWDDWDGMYEYMTWEVYMEPDESSFLEDALGGEYDPDIGTVLSALRDRVSFLAFIEPCYGYVYVIKSPWVVEGVGPVTHCGHPDDARCIRDMAVVGDDEAYALPPDVIDNALEGCLDEYVWDEDIDPEVYRCSA